LEETITFFQNLPQDTSQALEETETDAILTQTLEKRYSDLALQEGTLLFYLKGEVLKLGSCHLDKAQTAAFEAICGKMKKAVALVRHWKSGESEANKIGTLFREVCEELSKEADKLGIYGGAVRYIAEEARRPLKYLPDC